MIEINPNFPEDLGADINTIAIERKRLQTDIVARIRTELSFDEDDIRIDVQLDDPTEDNDQGRGQIRLMTKNVSLFNRVKNALEANRKTWLAHYPHHRIEIEADALMSIDQPRQRAIAVTIYDVQ